MRSAVDRLMDVIELEVSFAIAKEQALAAGLPDLAAVAELALRRVRQERDDAEREVALEEAAAEREESAVCVTD